MIRCAALYDNRDSPARASPSRWLAASAGVALVLLLGCQREISFPLRTAAGARLNVLLVTIDTLRADHLTAYGYELPTSPNIDRLAASGVRVDECISPAPETAPAMASLVTGLYQHRSRVAFNRHKLAPHVLTLAERMQAAGYATAGFAGNGLVGAKYGFDQGFDHFEDYDRSPFVMTQDDRGVDLALAWLDTGPAAPWFVWLHLKDPHGPYNSADPSWSADLSYPPLQVGDTAVPVASGNFGLGVIPRYQFLAEHTRLADYVRRYDGEIRWSDAQVGRLLDRLREDDLDEQTLVILTADHGESLTEHDEYLQHGWFLYDTTLRVPLIVSLPGTLPAGRVVDVPVSLVDVVPTLDEMLGLTPGGTEGALDGRSVAGVFAGRARAVKSVPAFAIGPRPNHQYAVREAGWKLIHTPAGRPITPADATGAVAKHAPTDAYELYDLRTDPGETRNLAGTEPERRALLARALARFRQTCQFAGLW